MSEFSEYLDYYMEENGISTADLSQQTGLERTLIYRYRKGSRTPADEEIVVRLAAVLRMNASEKKKFIEKYDCLSIGEFAVNSYQYVKKLLKKLKDTGENPMPQTFLWNTSLEDHIRDTVFHIHSGDEIISCISALFTHVKEKESELLLMMQPVYEAIQKLIPSIFRSSGVRIEQIVCLEQRFSRSYKNLEIFQWVLPLCFEQMNYDVRYYYDFLKYHINSMSWMPNVLISGDYTVQFDYEMQHGILIKDSRYADMMREQFGKIKAKTSSFLKSTEGQMAVLDMYNMVNQKNSICMFEQPCLGLGISSDIYENFLYPFPEKSEFIKGMAEFNGDWEDMKYIPASSWHGPMQSFCKVGSMRTFMETGRVNEFPPGFYEELSMDVRKKVLLRMMHAIRKGEIVINVLPDEIQVPRHLFFYWSEENRQMSVKCVTEHEMSEVLVKEPGIYQAFCGFFDYLQKKNLIMDQRGVLEELEKLRKEYW